jgi:hypothetical protein
VTYIGRRRADILALAIPSLWGHSPCRTQRPTYAARAVYSECGR